MKVTKKLGKILVTRPEKRKTDNELMKDALDEVHQAGFDFTVPPIDILMEFWINKVVRLQASLANRAVISVLFDKYCLVETLAHFKKLFFCERGDLVSDLIHTIYTAESKVDKFAIMNMTTLFQSFESQKLPDIKFKVQMRRETALEHGLTSLTPVRWRLLSFTSSCLPSCRWYRLWFT